MPRNKERKIVKASSPPEVQVESEFSGIGEREIIFSYLGFHPAKFEESFSTQVGRNEIRVSVSYDENLLPYLKLLQHFYGLEGTQAGK
jgi:hypothetical protein